jgi:flagellar biosynthesis/type III secretory pathway protein FliH
LTAGDAGWRSTEEVAGERIMSSPSAIEEGIEEGIEEAIEEGIEEGIEEAIEEGIESGFVASDVGFAGGIRSSGITDH